MKSFIEQVADEVASAKAAFPPFASEHEGYAILLEEVDELWDEVKVNQKLRDYPKMFRELVQVAAMAQRMADDLVSLKAQDQEAAEERLRRNVDAMNNR